MSLGFGKKLKTSEVFGISQSVLEHSYVDRGHLDQHLNTRLSRNIHIALRGESKCGKSWLRQKNIPNAITVQCRLKKTAVDIYIDALSQLGVKLTVEEGSKLALKGTIEGTHEAGNALITKTALKLSTQSEVEKTEKSQKVGHDINDLRFIAELILQSGRRLVIEDFHYMSSSERKSFSFDLKALWDYGCFVIIIGIWADHNLLLHLNPDLSGRVEEISIFWSPEDLRKVIDRGCGALGIYFSEKIKNSLVNDAFGTVGILQNLILSTIDNAGYIESQLPSVSISDYNLYESAGMAYAEQLNALYQTFALRVSGGIRRRRHSTGIYAHMMAVICDAGDEKLISGMHIGEIFRLAQEKEGRIQRGNLRTILEKIDSIQVDDDGRGLVITYDSHQEQVFIVDKQLFLYRKYATVKWPWERLIEEVNEGSDGYDGEAEG